MFDFYGNPRRKYPTEFDEIAKIIASRKPRVTWDDICDQLLRIWQHEKTLKKSSKKRKPKSRKVNTFET